MHTYIYIYIPLSLSFSLCLFAASTESFRGCAISSSPACRLRCAHREPLPLTRAPGPDLVRHSVWPVVTPPPCFSFRSPCGIAWCSFTVLPAMCVAAFSEPCSSARHTPAMTALLLCLPRTGLGLLLELLGVAGCPMLVQCAPEVTSVGDVATLRAKYAAARRVFVLPRRLQAAFAQAAALPPPAAYMRLGRVLLHIVRRLVQPLLPPAPRLAYPGFGELGVLCMQLASPCQTQAPWHHLLDQFELPYATAEALSPVELLDALALQALPHDILSAWIALNDGVSARRLRRVRALLRLGTYQVEFFPPAWDMNRSAAFALHFQVLGTRGALLALEPDVDVAGFLRP